MKDFHEWAEADAKKTLDANPATFGIVRVRCRNCIRSLSVATTFRCVTWSPRCDRKLSNPS